MSRISAKAIAVAALDPGRHGGKTYELGGPQVMTMEELYAAAGRAAGREPDLVPMPSSPRRCCRASAGCRARRSPATSGRCCRPTTCPATRSKGLEAFGIQPTPLGAVAPEWLGRYRQGGRFAMRPADQPL